MTPKKIYKKAKYNKERLTLKEQAILATDAKYSTLYAIYAKGRRFPDAEEAIKLDEDCKAKYEKEFGPIPNIKLMNKFNSFLNEVFDETEINPDNAEEVGIETPPDVNQDGLDVPPMDLNDKDKVLKDLYNQLDQKYDLDTAITSVTAIAELDEQIENIKTFSVGFIRSANIPDMLKDSYVKGILKCESMGDLLALITFSLA